MAKRKTKSIPTSEAAAAMGRLGGAARMASLSPEERTALAASGGRASPSKFTSETARALARKRWGDKPKPPPAPKRPRGRPRKVVAPQGETPPPQK